MNRDTIYYEGQQIAEIDETEKQLDHCLDCGAGLSEEELDLRRAFCFSCLRPGGDRIDD